MYILLLTIPALPVSWIKTYTFLSYFSLASLVIALSGLVMIFGYLIKKVSLGEVIDEPLKEFNFGQMISNSVAVVFVYVGNTVILNLRAEAIDKKKFPSLLVTSTLTTLVIYMIYASMAVYVYRSQTPSVFIDAMVPINGFVTAVQACVCVNAFFSYPL